MANSIIKEAYVYYAQLKRPALKWQQKEVKGKPLANKEYVVDALLKADDLDKLVRHYKKKGVKSVSEVKYLDKEAFTKRFKTEPPTDEAYQTDGDYAIIKFRKHASYKDGNPTPNPPSVVGFASLGNKSKNGYDITGRDTLIGNGSLVNIEISERSYPIPAGKKGLAIDLWGIQVIDLIPYEVGGVGFEDAGEVIEKKSEEIDEDFDEDFDDSEGFDDAGEQQDSSEEEEDDDDWEA